MLTCPYCQTEFELTWARYIKAPFGGHVCPYCLKKSRLATTFRYVVALFCVAFVTTSVGFVLAGAVVFLLQPLMAKHVGVHLNMILQGGSFGVGMILANLLVMPPVDKYLDSRLRYLRPVKKQRRLKHDPDKGHWVVDE